MKKVFLQGSLLIIVFIFCWFAFSKVDWVNIFKVKQATITTEERLGKLIWENINESETENNDPQITNYVDSIINTICRNNNIDPKYIKAHIIDKDEVNAFAIPDGHLVIYSGLISASENPDELAGVISHEIAHIELRHVMKKLVKEIGLSVLISITTGSHGGEGIKNAARQLSSSAFDRGMEKEADLKAVDYLVKAKVNPEAFANFLYRLSKVENGLNNNLSWISTHPESKERAEYIVSYSNNKNVNYSPVLTEKSWNNLKALIAQERLNE